MRRGEQNIGTSLLLEKIGTVGIESAGKILKRVNDVGP